ncbi:UDP-N-acetylmuramoyl-L-alanyl-D-glutamate--2,6-diaminopimelate ligase [Melioribacter sp. OK-6-Me]|uniref:UDP-N-acetylmuramoyl-L-alanyl-D-glutamate--2, 6-diaminopimelate ligase n=1 Tax=unclassified Melioribacter TaxID=2627329 RepID=UPI003EDB2759
MKLSELLNNVHVKQVTGNAEEKEINNLSIDSRNVDKYTLFFAIKGFKTDGHKFIQDALNKGVQAVVLQDPEVVPDMIFEHCNAVRILVEDSRKALAEFSDRFYNSPSKKIKLIGVTGTKGKTTTAFYLKSLFKFAGYNAGLIGTIANYIGDEEFKTMLTTPQSHEINYLLDRMVKADCKYCSMEVSSHALDLHRVDFLDFDYAIFTNITSDHMDYHLTFDNYLKAKKILFDMLPQKASAVINADDPSANEIVRNTKAKVVSYGTSEKADFRIKDIRYSLDGTDFVIVYKNKEHRLHTKLIGHFNAYNAAAAFAVGVLESIEIEKVVSAIENSPQVPGRFEVVSEGEKKVIIDYAHTADSLMQALKAIRNIVGYSRPVYTVFGCGGDRDRSKRPIMGRIASEMSTKVFVTSDNPRTENPSAIINEIIHGITKSNYSVIENREEAIKEAIQQSEKNAVILIAGKGHENYQEINGVRKHFSDKETAIKYLNL